jgi:hypothetical protein
MSLFEKKFMRLLEFDDLQQQSNGPAKSPWHRKAARGSGAANQHQVADRYKGRYTGEGDFKFSGELNRKIEMIRNGTSDLQVLSDVDCDHILKNYPISELPRDKPKSLSNSGMVVNWDPVKSVYILTKQ